LRGVSKDGHGRSACGDPSRRRCAAPQDEGDGRGGTGETMAEHRLVVWYNTRCPVCDAGIDWQRNKLLTAVRAGQLSFRDINQEPQARAAYGASLDDVRRRLHATDEPGRLIVGADVAIAIWRITPGEGWLASLFGNPAMLPVTRFAYDRFADLLFAWNRRKGRW
jgi:predicted DCC family thiol-disulfide oxidoreductase YuxK